MRPARAYAENYTDEPLVRPTTSKRAVQNRNKDVTTRQKAGCEDTYEDVGEE